MSGVFSRSWRVTKLTFSIINKNKKLLFFPFFAFLLSALFLFLVIIFWISGSLFINQAGFLEYLTIFLMYFGLVFIGSVFSTGIVHSSAMIFSGKKVRFWDSLGFSFRRIGKIFLWSSLSATIGLIFHLIESLGRRTKNLGGKILLMVTRGLLGMAWTISTIFVIQGITYHNLSPFKAIKDSVQVLRKTWGESLVRYFGFGLAGFILFLAGLAIIVPGYLLTSGFGSGGILTALIIFSSYTLILILTFNAAKDIFNTALYIYAKTRKVPYGFDENILARAFKPKKGKKTRKPSVSRG